MDILDVTHTAGRPGEPQVFVADTNGDLERYLAGDPESAAVIVRIYDPFGRVVTEIIEERHQGRSRTVAEVDGKPSDIEVVSVVERDQIEFSVTGLPISHREWRWSITANNLPGDGNFYCDEVGVGPDGRPSLPPGAPEPSTTAAPSTTAPSAVKAHPSSSGANGSGFDLVWVYVAVAIIGGAGVFWWFRWWLSGGSGEDMGGGSAPATPPPDQNDFVE